MNKLLTFQRRFLRAAFAPGVEIAALSLPRGNAKSTIAARLLARSMRRGDPLFVEGADNKLIAGSHQQARVVFRLLRAELGEDGYRYEDSNQSTKVLHLDTFTRVVVHGANAKTLLGFLGVRLLVVDEPAAVSDEMWGAIVGSCGKTKTTILCVGTIAPATSPHWWPALLARGSRPGVHVTLLQGDREKWSQWSTIKKANPISAVNPILKATLIRECAEAQRDDRLKSRFLSDRLNLPTKDETSELIAAHDWDRMLERAVPEREGSAVLAIDLGASRSWSAATLMWRNGRTEVYASVPGIPSLESQERRDGLTPGILQELVDCGVVGVSYGLRMADIDALLDLIPSDVQIEAVVADRFALATLQDAVIERGYPDPEFVINQWSTASTAIAAFRSCVLDGPMSMSQAGRLLASVSVSQASVESDSSGSTRMKKGHRRNRDDVAQSLVLAAMLVVRWRRVQISPPEVYTLSAAV